MNKRTCTLNQIVLGILFALFFTPVGHSQISITPPTNTNVTIECDGIPNDPPTIIANYHTNFTVINNCGTVAWTNNYSGIAGGACVGTGTTSVTYTADDGCNTDNVTINFTVIDNTPPDIITNPSNPIVQCDNFSIGDYTSWLNAHGNAVADDACSSIGNSSGSPSWSHMSSFNPGCPTTGTYNVTFTVKDDCGNTSSVGATFTIIDSNPPVISPMAIDMMEECGGGNDQSLLQNWINNKGGGIASEGCSAPTWINFNYITNDAIPQTGVVAFGDFPNYPQVPTNNCNWSVRVTFNVSDFCGNINSTTADFSMEDTTPPVVTAPVDVTTECDNVPDVGTPTITDLCDTSFDIVVSSDTVVGACPNEIVITRTWMATDDCGNSGMDSQVITVQDNVAPTFVLPADVTIDCDDVGNTSLTGSPSNLADNCDNNSSVSFSDNTVVGGCGNSYMIERTWTAIDACGNTSSQLQMISVQDLTKPDFTTFPQSMTISCVDDISSDAAYNDWLNNFGGGAATDNCGAITWMVLEPGSYDINDASTFTSPAIGLSLASCPSSVQGIYRTNDVSFVAVDECGNAIDATVTFSVIDDTSPVFVDCPIDVTLNNDPGICGADFILSYPFITDNCNGNVTSIDVTQTETITSPNPGDDLTFVDPVVFNISSLPMAPAVASDPITLTIDLTNFDGEEPTEHFIIEGEDGTQLGLTNNSPMQCGNSSTSITLTVAQIHDWVSTDGELTIRLIPNPTQDPVFSVNDICPEGPPTGGGSTATINLIYTAEAPNGLVYEYSINNGARVQVPAGTEVPYTFDLGSNQVEYFATDCAGNSSSCSYSVTVWDTEPPAMICPTDLTLSLPITADCSVGTEVDLIPPMNITDNCGFQNMFSQVQPQSPSQALLTFAYEPNYLDYIAENKSITFYGTGGNAVNGNAVFTVRIEGDVEDSDEYYEIYGEDDSLIGYTQAGQPNVTVTPGTCPELSVSTTVIEVPVDIFNVWAADGEVTITAKTPISFITPPAGVVGDGISPACTTFANGTPDGQNDGVSNITVVLEYQSVAPTYTATGATTIPNSIFPVPLAPVTHTFNVGTTTVTYQVEDVNGIVNTCSYDVVIEDNIAPTAMCQDVIIYVNPDGGNYILDPSEIDLGSSDNCGISGMSVFPNTFTCTDVGSTVDVTLEVTDAAGNTSTCISAIAIQALQLSPTFSVGMCGNEDLNLFANAPSGIYTYEWQGPNGFVSFDENPTIQNAGTNYSGSYVVQITGQGGCTSVGAMTLAIDPAVDTPPIAVVEAEVCSNKEIELTTQSYSGNGVNYHWYQGIPGSGSLISTTQVPSYSIANPQIGNYSFYIIVEADGCFSETSGTIGVEVLEVPAIVSISNNQVDCATGNEDIILTPLTSIPGNFTYQWIGPNGFTSSSPEAVLPSVSSSDNGSYTLTLLTNDGCISDSYTHVVNVDDLPPTPMITTLDNQLCEGEVIQLHLVNNTYSGVNISYDWQTPGQGIITTTTGSLTINNTNPSDSGNYAVMVTVDGCTSLLSGDFLINVNSTPPTPFPSSNAPICEGESLQLTTDFIPGATYFWTGPNNFNSTIQNPSIFPIENIHEGNYSVSVMVNGCLSDVSFPLQVQVKSSPNPVIALNSGGICLDDPSASLELIVSSSSALPFATYTWYSMTNGNVVGGPTSDLSVNISDLNTYGLGTHGFYVVAEAEGCLSPPSDPTFVEFNDIPNNNAFAGDDMFVCDDSSISLNAQTPSIGSGIWSQTSGSPISIANPNEANTSISGLEAGQVYTFAWTLSNGACTNYSTDEIAVSVDGVMALAQAGEDFQLCEETTVTLNATPVNGGVTGTWTQPSSQQFLGVQITDANNPNTTVTGLAPDNTFQFTWTLSNQGCGEFASDIIIITTESTQGIDAFAGVDLVICGDNEAFMNAEVPPVEFQGTWSTSTGATISQPNQSNTYISDLEIGENIFTWTLSSAICGEFSSDEVVVFYHPSPLANDDDFEISFNSTLDFEVLLNDSIVGDYTLSFSNPSHGTLEENDGVFNYTSDLVYVGTDQFEYEICSTICPEECSKATVTLNVGQDGPCEVPTIFTPNNDGINDEFVIPCFGTGDYPENLVSIFNQWGDEVYRKTNYQNDWRGTFNGNDLPVGTYFFIVDYGNGLKPKSGFLVLER